MAPGGYDPAWRDYALGVACKRTVRLWPGWHNMVYVMSSKTTSRQERRWPGERWLASFLGLPTVQFLITWVCKNGGGRPGPFYHMNDINVYLGRQRGEGSPIETTRKNELEALSCSFCFSYWSFEHSQSERHTAPGSKRRMRERNVLFRSAHHRCVLAL